MAKKVTTDDNHAEKGDDKEPDDSVQHGGRTRVFVYGTLKRGMPNHYLLEGSPHLGDCSVGNNFGMVNMGWFPGVVRGANVDGVVHGEVYEVDLDTLNALDILEGHPTFFKRHKVQTDFKNAWIYLVGDEYAEAGDRIASGRWDGRGNE